MTEVGSSPTDLCPRLGKRHRYGGATAASQSLKNIVKQRGHPPFITRQYLRCNFYCWHSLLRSMNRRESWLYFYFLFFIF
jgi:hypothetical protein